jgi:type IV fimbrial biogenesis protein FimT
MKAMFIMKLKQHSLCKSGSMPDGSPNTQWGFTIAEMMITILIVMILLAVAAPSFLNSIQNNRYTALANEFLTSLQLARSEAVKRNRVVSVEALAAVADNQWAGGWRVWTDINGNGNFDADEQLFIKQLGRNDIRIDSLEDLDKISYRPSGILQNALANNTTVIELRPLNREYSGDVRNIIISRAGHVNVEKVPH